MATDSERLAILETKYDLMIELLKGTEHEEGMLATVKRIDDKLTRYESRWGVFAMIASAVGAALVTFKDWIIAHLG